MDTSNTQIFDAPLRKRINQMTDELTVFIHDTNLKGVLDSGVMIWNPQVLSWYVQYRPHNDPSEEYIGVECSLSIKQSEKEALYYCLLTWSHGDVIKPYIDDEVVSYQNLDELVVYTCEQWDRLKPTFLEDMKQEMQIDRPPVYRLF